MRPKRSGDPALEQLLQTRRRDFFRQAGEDQSPLLRHHLEIEGVLQLSHPVEQRHLGKIRQGARGGETRQEGDVVGEGEAAGLAFGAPPVQLPERLGPERGFEGRDARPPGPEESLGLRLPREGLLNDAHVIVVEPGVLDAHEADGGRGRESGELGAGDEVRVEEEGSRLAVDPRGGAPERGGVDRARRAFQAHDQVGAPAGQRKDDLSGVLLGGGQPMGVLEEDGHRGVRGPGGRRPDRAHGPVAGHEGDHVREAGQVRPGERGAGGFADEGLRDPLPSSTPGARAPAPPGPP